MVLYCRKPTYEEIHAVQTPAVQGSTVLNFSYKTHSCCHFEQGAVGQETALLPVNCFHAEELPTVAGEVGT